MKRTLAVLAAATVAVIVAAIFFEDRTTGQPRGAAQPPTQNQDPLPGTKLSVDELKKQFFHVSAGRRLKPAAWPNGARVAMAIGFDIDNASPNLARGDLSLEALSRGEYGAIDGLRRVLAVLEKHSVPATFFVPAVSDILHPQMIKDIVAKKRHEVAVHGWIHENASLLAPGEEKRLLDQSVEYLTRQTGKRPVGYRSPGAGFSRNTIQLLKDSGFVYESTLMASDDPYEILIDGEPSGLVEVSTEWILDDAPYFGRTGSLPSPQLIFQAYKDEFEVAYEEGASMLAFMFHPHVLGHRSRIVHLDKWLTELKARSGVWFATHEDVANYAKKNAAATN
jgi:peptidoglycan/xylan/chitin deacetylase (PgdA/CDA1 family)